MRGHTQTRKRQHIMSIFEKGQSIGEFKVESLIKKGVYAESYEVKDKNGKSCFLKLVCLAKLQWYQLDENGNDIEINIVRGLDHPNLCSHITEGEIIIGGQKYVYLVNEFEKGKTLNEFASELKVPVDTAKEIALEVLDALKYLHERQIPIIHNEVRLQNILLNEQGEVKLIDFGNSRFLSQGIARPNLKDVNVFYMAPERFNGVFSVQTDLYSVGVLLYQLIFNQLPYYFNLSLFDDTFKLSALRQAREQELQMPPIQIDGMDESLFNIIKKAIANDVDQRFQSADEFISALEDGLVESNADKEEDADAAEEETEEDDVDGAAVAACMDEKQEVGNGFADIAGMEDVKSVITRKIINLLKDPAKAEKYKLKLPNGVMLYGPPGCGKTIWAQKLAEEAKYKYMYVRATDVLRIYVQDAHNVISQLFAEAEKAAPIVICLDELEQLVPAKEVLSDIAIEASNELLQLVEGCIERGIFVVGITSRPDLTDAAITKQDRIEQKIYIPMPDLESRESLFKNQLAGRPLSDDIDYTKLADLSNNFVVNDIAFVVNDAALRASENDSEISQSMLEEIIKSKKPSVSADTLKGYEEMRDAIEHRKTEEVRHVGFK